MRYRFPPGSRVLRGVIVVGPLLALYAGAPQGIVPPVWLTVVLLVFALSFATLPEHYTGGFTLAIVVTFWVIRSGHDLPGTSVLAAAALLVTHLAAVVAGYGPRQLPPDRGVLLLWARRGVLVWLMAPLTWLVVEAQSDRATSAAYWIVGLVVGVVLLVLTAAWYPTQADGRG
jgi:hypothetical protein